MIFERKATTSTVSNAETMVVAATVSAARAARRNGALSEGGKGMTGLGCQAWCAPKPHLGPRDGRAGRVRRGGAPQPPRSRRCAA